MKFSEKLRAGRATLNLTQEELANAADISLSSIKRIELDDGLPGARIQAKILQAFERKGIHYTDRGIEREEYPIYFTHGDTHEAAYLQLLEDAFDHLREIKDPELLIMFADDKVSPPSVNDMYRQMRGAGIKMRQLIEEGNTYIMGELDEYRYVPKGQFLNRVTLIYGDKIANEMTDPCYGMIRLDPLNAKIQRNTFNILWDTLAQPTHTTAEERYE